MLILQIIHSQRRAECGIIIIIITPSTLAVSALLLFLSSHLWRLFSTWKSHIPEELCGPAASNVSQIDVHTHAQHTGSHPHAVARLHACSPCCSDLSIAPRTRRKALSALPVTEQFHAAVIQTLGLFFNLLFLCLPSVDVDNLGGLSQEGKAPSSFLSRDCVFPQSRSQNS